MPLYIQIATSQTEAQLIAECPMCGAMTFMPVAYAWAVNGIASVVASVAGIFVAIHFGLSRAMLAGAACYAVALAWVLLSRESAPERSPGRARAASPGERPA